MMDLYTYYHFPYSQKLWDESATGQKPFGRMKRWPQLIMPNYQ